MSHLPSTYTFEWTTNQKEIKFILWDPTLYKLREGYEFNNNKSPFALKFGEYYILCKKDNKVIGLINYSLVNDNTLNAHINILPEHWGQDSREVGKAFIARLREFKKANIVLAMVTMVPKCCRHAMLYVRSLGFKRLGHISKCHYYGDELQDLIIMGVHI